MDFELRLLRNALTLSEHRNFARAAKALHLSQPSLSRSIQSLEQQAGVQMFERNSRFVEVTDAGEIFLKYAHQVMAHSADLSREMDLLKGLAKGELQIGVGTYVSVQYVDIAVGRIVRDHPNVRLRLANDNWSNLLPLLRQRELDLAVVAVGGIAEDEEIQITRLSRRQGYFAVRPEHPLLSSTKPLSIQDVLAYPLVSTSRFPSEVLRGLVRGSAPRASAARSEAKSIPSIACESPAMMKNIAQESDAIALVPLNLLLPDLRNRALAALPLVLPILKPQFGIIRMARRSLSPLGELFVRTMVDVDAEVLALEEEAAEKLFPDSRRSARKRAAKHSVE